MGKNIFIKNFMQHEVIWNFIGAIQKKQIVNYMSIKTFRTSLKLKFFETFFKIYLQYYSFVNANQMQQLFLKSKTVIVNHDAENV